MIKYVALQHQHKKATTSTSHQQCDSLKLNMTKDDVGNKIRGSKTEDIDCILSKTWVAIVESLALIIKALQFDCDCFE